MGGLCETIGRKIIFVWNSVADSTPYLDKKKRKKFMPILVKVWVKSLEKGSNVLSSKRVN